MANYFNEIDTPLTPAGLGSFWEKVYNVCQSSSSPKESKREKHQCFNGVFMLHLLEAGFGFNASVTGWEITFADKVRCEVMYSACEAKGRVLCVCVCVCAGTFVYIKLWEFVITRINCHKKDLPQELTTYIATIVSKYFLPNWHVLFSFVCVNTAIDTSQ